MKDLIAKKKTEYDSLKVKNKEYKEWLDNSDCWSFLYSMFSATGEKVSKGSVSDMVCGTLRGDSSLICYQMVQGFKNVRKDMMQECSMKSYPSTKLFYRWANELLPNVNIRENNRVVFEMGFIPCHFRDIEENLDEAFKKFAQSSKDLEAATLLFLDLIKVYAIGIDSVMASSMVFAYCLMALGFPLPEFSASEVEFNKLASIYFEENNHVPFYEMIERAVYNRLDAVVNVAKQVEENA